MKKYILLSLVLAACSSNTTTDGDDFCDKNYQYCLSKERLSSGSKWEPSMGMHGKTTSHTTSNNYPTNDPKSIYMEIYNNECPLTIRHMEEIRQTENTIWGQVVYKPSNDPAPGENDVFCPPLKPATSSYAFCAKKGEKAVAICLQQMTDNPDLAEEIFRTFRWKD